MEGYGAAALPLYVSVFLREMMDALCETRDNMRPNENLSSYIRKVTDKLLTEQDLAPTPESDIDPVVATLWRAAQERKRARLARESPLAFYADLPFMSDVILRQIINGTMRISESRKFVRLLKSRRSWTCGPT